MQRPAAVAVRERCDRTRVGAEGRPPLQPVALAQSGFTESYEGLGVKRTESGTLLMLKPGRMKWTIAHRPASSSCSTVNSRGSTRRRLSVQRIPAKELDDLRSPLRFLLATPSLKRK